jgi:hypothetical protein
MICDPSLYCRETAELVLQAEQSPLAKRLQYGMRLRLGDFQGAQAALDSLAPIGDWADPDVQFRLVQEINLARLAHTGSAFELSEQQRGLLQYIAEQPTPERAYARALLGLLEGQFFWPEIELPEGEALPFSGGTMSAPAPQQMTLAPNPSQGRFLLWLPEYSETEVQVSILNIAGQRLEQLRLGSGQQFELDMSGYPAGLYFIEVSTQSQLIGILKAIIK